MCCRGTVPLLPGGVRPLWQAGVAVGGGRGSSRDLRPAAKAGGRTAHSRWSSQHLLSTTVLPLKPSYVVA